MSKEFEQSSFYVFMIKSYVSNQGQIKKKKDSPLLYYSYDNTSEISRN